MRRMFVSMCTVLAASLGICIVAMMIQFRVLGVLDEGCKVAIEYVKQDNNAGAMSKVREIKMTLDDRGAFMELIASHDHVHEAVSAVNEARVALECEDIDDAYQALETLLGILEHMRDHETLSLANIC